MRWKKSSFRKAVQMLARAFASSEEYESLALVWREGGEYKVMGSWEVKAIRGDLREDRLRVVLWLQRAEAGMLLGPRMGWGK